MQNITKTVQSCFLLLGLTLFLPQLHGQSKKGFTLQGDITGIPNGQQVYLTLSQDAENPVAAKDSTQIQNGKFTLSGQLDYPELYTVVIKKPGASLENQRAQERFDYVFPIFLAQGSHTLKADAKPNMTYLEYGITNKYPYAEIQVTGSAHHQAYMDFLNGYTPFREARSKAFDRYIRFLNSGEKSAPGHTLKGISLVDSIDEAGNLGKNYVKAFMQRHPADPVGLYVARGYFLGGANVTEIDGFLKELSNDARQSKGGQECIAFAEKARRTAVGASFVDFDFKNAKDEAFKLSDVVGKGRYVLLEFWASWCHPCRADIPHIKEAYQKFHPAGFEIISISMDDNKKQWLQAIEQEQMPWLQVSDLKAFEGELAKVYRFTGIPFCVLVDPEGKIVTRNMRGSWMDRWLVQLYGNKFDAT